MGIKVSVIMPVYNSAHYVRDAIDSILGQTHTDIEFIIIDDASTDDSVEIVKSYSDSRIRLVVKDQNTGYTDSLNIGIETAKGDYIARMDSDDISFPDRFAKQIAVLEAEPRTVVCGTAVELIPQGGILSYPCDSEMVKIALLDNCAMAHPTVMMRRSFLLETGLRYDRTFEPSEDYDLWTRIVHAGNLSNIAEPLLKYRQHAQQVSQIKDRLQKRNADRCRLRMLGYVADGLSEKDQRKFQVTYGLIPASNIAEIYEIMEWWHRLISNNQKRKVFDAALFKEFADRKRRALVTQFFLKRYSYTPSTLFEYIFSRRIIKGYLSVTDWLKLLVKSLTFRTVSLPHRNNQVLSEVDE
jgi:glycosyltransferase involved in cell wall biosynthesis